MCVHVSILECLSYSIHLQLTPAQAKKPMKTQRRKQHEAGVTACLTLMPAQFKQHQASLPLACIPIHWASRARPAIPVKKETQSTIQNYPLDLEGKQRQTRAKYSCSLTTSSNNAAGIIPLRESSRLAIHAVNRCMEVGYLELNNRL